MKRIIIAFLLILIVTGIYFGTSVYIKNVCAEAETLVDKAIERYEKDKTAEKETQKLEKYWDKKETVLSAFINNQKISDTVLSITAMKTSAKYKNDALFYQYANEIKATLKEIAESNRITIRSFF